MLGLGLGLGVKSDVEIERTNERIHAKYISKPAWSQLLIFGDPNLWYRMRVSAAQHLPNYRPLYKLVLGVRC